MQNIFMIAGGLGLFLYGMKMMMDGLEKLAGNRMRTIVERATSNRFLGIAVGAVVTIVIQSSTATSVMAVGFINAGLMSLSQAISLIIGAHIGTTFTAHIFAFRIDSFAPLFIFFGIVIYLFMRKKVLKDSGFILLGIGILFFGLSVMGGPLREFADTPSFQTMLTAFENPFLAILSGFVFTAIIQSSTAATAILIAIYGGGADLNFATAAFLILGISAGTTVTALLASLAGRRESKRMALANLIFVSTGCVVFGILLSIFPGVLNWFTNTWQDGARQVAMFYTFFKVGLTVLFMPFVRHLAALMYKLIPKRSKSEGSKELHYIKSDSHQTQVTITQVYNELSRMGQMAVDNLTLALDAFHSGDDEKISTVVEVESSINYLGRQISSLLTQKMQNVESLEDTKKLSTMLYIASDLGRIGDHAENIVEYNIRTKKKGKLRLSPEAMEELATLGSAVIEMLSLTMEVFTNNSDDLIQRINKKEEEISSLYKLYTKSHIKRLKNDKCDPRGGVAFISMVKDLERCADHANGIANYFLDMESYA